MEIIHATGVEGARHARGLAIVIDVLRSFTVSAYALAGGALECRLVTTTDEARALVAATPRAVICAEEEGLPVEGIAISNSPTQIRAVDLKGCVLVQRSSAGTPVAASVHEGVDIFAASLVVARATAQACLSRRPDALTLIASADYPEDHACARYIEALINGESPDLDRLLRPLRESERRVAWIPAVRPRACPRTRPLQLRDARHARDGLPQPDQGRSIPRKGLRFRAGHQGNPVRVRSCRATVSGEPPPKRRH
jgi:2-phosphosulfolactate phosphatase